MVRRVRRGRHPRRGHHLGRLPRDRRRGRGARAARPRRGAALRRHAHPRARTASASSCPAPSLNVTFAAGMPKAGQRRLHLAVGRALHLGARLGARRRASASRTSSRSATCSTSTSATSSTTSARTSRPSRSSSTSSRSTDAREFMTAARAFARTKPIVAYKAGRFPESAKAAASHTGALASEDAVYDAAFAARRHRAGLRDRRHLRLRRAGRPPRSRRPGRASASSPTPAGPGVMATDALIARRRRAGRARAGDDRGSSTRACRPPGRTATRWTCSATPARSASPRPPRSCSPTRAWTRCWRSSRRRR